MIVCSELPSKYFAKNKIFLRVYFKFHNVANHRRYVRWVF